MKPGRNDPCLCGSGRKYKQCCLAKGTAPSPDELLWRRLRRDLDGLLPDVLTGTEAEVLERSGSEGVEPGELLFAKIVPVEGVALMEACAPVLIPPQEKIQLIELRKKMSAASALSADGLREYDMELRTVL